MVDVEEPSNILRGISVSRYEGDSLLYITNDSFTKLCNDPESSNVWNCNNQFPWRQESPQGPADLGSAIGLAPQSPGLHDISQWLDGGIMVDIQAKESKFP